MGRNWHKPDDYDIRDSSGKGGAGTGGQLVVKDETGRTLMTFFNDSFEEAILEAYFRITAGALDGTQVTAETG